jgi:hypothetical protein
MTKEEVYKKHYAMWDWLYHHPDKEKKDYPGWRQNGGTEKKVINSCFLCEYYKEFDISSHYCPLYRAGQCIVNGIMHKNLKNVRNMLN